MTDLFKELIPSILQTKVNVVETDKEYPAYVVNRALSFHYDCVMHANEMNMLPNTPALLQYHYLLNIIRPYKRPYQKWHKKESVEALDAIKEYYGYSNEKAKDALNVLTDAQIDEIKRRIEKGGLKHVGHKRTNRGETPRT